MSKGLRLDPSRFFLPYTEPLPSVPQLRSPIKRKASSQDLRASECTRELFSEKRRKIDLPPIEKLPHPQSLQVKTIEQSMEVKNLPAEKRLLIRTKILKIVHSQDLPVDGQMVDLGVVHYYCASGRESALNSEESLFKQRLKEMEETIRELNKASKKSQSDDSTRTSGIRAYLLSSFAKIIFPPDGGFNLGGCYLVTALLNSSLSLHLSPETHDQIYSIIISLISIDDLRELFIAPISLHPQMAKLICMEMRFSSQERLSFVHIRWSLLLALFSSFGQEGEGNCYAVATLMNLMSTDPAGLVRLLREILEKSSFSFRGKEMPILPLLENRIPKSKRSFLQLMLLEVIQFAAHNGEQAILPGTFPFKRETMGTIYAKTSSSFWAASLPTPNKTLFRPYEHFFSSFLNEYLYVVDYHHSSCSIEQNWVKFAFHSQGFKFNGTLSDYKPFYALRRLYRWTNDQFFPIDTLTGFSSFCVELWNAISLPEELDPTRQAFCQYLSSPSYRKLLAEGLVAYNKGTKLTWEDYFNSDSFFMRQKGGHCGMTAGLPAIQRTFTNLMSVEGSDPSEIFSALCHSLRDYADRCGAIEKMDPMILASSSNHAFNFTPFRFQKYWQNEGRELQERVINPGERVTKTVLTRVQMWRTLHYVFGPEEADAVMRSIPEENLTALDFFKQASDFIAQSEQEEFSQMIRLIQRQIHRPHWVDSLPAILEPFSLSLEPAVLQKVQDHFMKECRDYMTPFQVASAIHETLLLHFSQNIERPQLEEFLCQFFTLPEIVEVANLNWVDDSSEQAHPVYLVLSYDTIHGGLLFQQRCRGDLMPLKTPIKDGKFHLYFPI